MSPLNLNLEPQNMAQTFSQYVKAIIQIIFWATICLASLAASYVVLRAIWNVVESVTAIIRT